MIAALEALAKHRAGRPVSIGPDLTARAGEALADRPGDSNLIRYWLRGLRAAAQYWWREGHLVVPPGHHEQVGDETVDLNAWMFYVSTQPQKVPGYVQAALNALGYATQPTGPGTPWGHGGDELMELDVEPGRQARPDPRPAATSPPVFTAGAADLPGVEQAGAAPEPGREQAIIAALAAAHRIRLRGSDIGPELPPQAAEALADRPGDSNLIRFWLQGLRAAAQYWWRKGHLEVPSGHLEQVGNKTVVLSGWMFYVRTHPQKVPGYVQAVLNRWQSVTMNDVAARAGVNQATVSRALHGKGARTTTRQKVLDAAEQLGYRPPGPQGGRSMDAEKMDAPAPGADDAAAQDTKRPKPRSVSMSDIATKTGFNRNTVSRALHDKPMPPATYQKVLDAAEQLGYRLPGRRGRRPMDADKMDAPAPGADDAAAQDTKRPKPRSVSMSDVAARVGVAQPTVSRVLNDKHLVRMGTRRKVLEAAKQLGYRLPGPRGGEPMDLNALQAALPGATGGEMDSAAPVASLRQPPSGPRRGPSGAGQPQAGLVPALDREGPQEIMPARADAHPEAASGDDDPASMRRPGSGGRVRRRKHPYVRPVRLVDQGQPERRRPGGKQVPVALTPPERPAAVRSAATPHPAAVAAGTCIEVFTGSGALALALEEAGFVHLAVNDHEWRAYQTLLGNRARPYADGAAPPASLGDPWPLLGGDISGIDFRRWEGRVDLLAGGVPCQPWSVTGSQQGPADDRNLWPEFLSVIRQLNPKAVLAENVPGLLSPKFEPYFQYILRQLAAPFVVQREGEDWTAHDQRLIREIQDPDADPAQRFDVRYVEVNAADYGAAQDRVRVFITAFRRDLGLPRWMPPPETHSKVALQHSQSTGEYWRRHGTKPRPELRPARPPFPSPQQPWRTLQDAIADMPEPQDPHDEQPDPSGWLHHTQWPGGKEWDGRRASDLDRPSKTITTQASASTVVRLGDGSLRYLTVAEVKQLVGLPKWWWLAGSRNDQIRLLGNAVPLPLGRAFADSIAAMLRSTRLEDLPGSAANAPGAAAGSAGLPGPGRAPAGPAAASITGPGERRGGLPGGRSTAPQAHQGGTGRGRAQDARLPDDWQQEIINALAAERAAEPRQRGAAQARTDAALAAPRASGSDSRWLLQVLALVQYWRAGHTGWPERHTEHVRDPATGAAQEIALHRLRNALTRTTAGVPAWVRAAAAALGMLPDERQWLEGPREKLEPDAGRSEPDGPDGATGPGLSDWQRQGEAKRLVRRYMGAPGHFDERVDEVKEVLARKAAAGAGARARDLAVQWWAERVGGEQARRTVAGLDTASQGLLGGLAGGSGRPAGPQAGDAAGSVTDRRGARDQRGAAAQGQTRQQAPEPREQTRHQGWLSVLAALEAGRRTGWGDPGSVQAVGEVLRNRGDGALKPAESRILRAAVLLRRLYPGKDDLAAPDGPLKLEDGYEVDLGRWLVNISSQLNRGGVAHREATMLQAVDIILGPARLWSRPTGYALRAGRAEGIVAALVAEKAAGWGEARAADWTDKVLVGERGDNRQVASLLQGVRDILAFRRTRNDGPPVPGSSAAKFLRYRSTPGVANPEWLARTLGVLDVPQPGVWAISTGRGEAIADALRQEQAVGWNVYEMTDKSRIIENTEQALASQDGDNPQVTALVQGMLEVVAFRRGGNEGLPDSLSEEWPYGSSVPGVDDPPWLVGARAALEVPRRGGAGPPQPGQPATAGAPAPAPRRRVNAGRLRQGREQKWQPILAALLKGRYIGWDENYTSAEARDARAAVDRAIIHRQRGALRPDQSRLLRAAVRHRRRHPGPDELIVPAGTIVHLDGGDQIDLGEALSTIRSRATGPDSSAVMRDAMAIIVGSQLGGPAQPRAGMRAWAARVAGPRGPRPDGGAGGWLARARQRAREQLLAGSWLSEQADLAYRQLAADLGIAGTPERTDGDGFFDTVIDIFGDELRPFAEPLEAWALRMYLYLQLAEDWLRSDLGQETRYAHVFFPGHVTKGNDGEAAAARQKARDQGRDLLLAEGQLPGGDQAADRHHVARFAARVWGLPMTLLGTAGPRHIGPPELPAIGYLYYDQQAGRYTGSRGEPGQVVSAEQLRIRLGLVELAVPDPPAWVSPADRQQLFDDLAAYQHAIGQLRARFDQLARPGDERGPALRGRQLLEAFDNRWDSWTHKTVHLAGEILDQFAAVVAALQDTLAPPLPGAPAPPGARWLAPEEQPPAQDPAVPRLPVGAGALPAEDFDWLGWLTEWWPLEGRPQGQAPDELARALAESAGAFEDREDMDWVPDDYPGTSPGPALPQTAAPEPGELRPDRSPAAPPGVRAGTGPTAAQHPAREEQPLGQAMAAAPVRAPVQLPAPQPTPLQQQILTALENERTAQWNNHSQARATDAALTSSGLGARSDQRRLLQDVVLYRRDHPEPRNLIVPYPGRSDDVSEVGKRLYAFRNLIRGNFRLQRHRDPFMQNALTIAVGEGLGASLASQEEQPPGQAPAAAAAGQAAAQLPVWNPTVLQRRILSALERERTAQWNKGSAQAQATDAAIARKGRGGRPDQQRLLQDVVLLRRDHPEPRKLIVVDRAGQPDAVRRLAPRIYPYRRPGRGNPFMERALTIILGEELGAMPRARRGKRRHPRNGSADAGQTSPRPVVQDMAPPDPGGLAAAPGQAPAEPPAWTPTPLHQQILDALADERTARWNNDSQARATDAALATSGPGVWRNQRSFLQDVVRYRRDHPEPGNLRVPRSWHDDERNVGKRLYQFRKKPNPSPFMQRALTVILGEGLGAPADQDTGGPSQAQATALQTQTPGPLPAAAPGPVAAGPAAQQAAAYRALAADLGIGQEPVTDPRNWFYDWAITTFGARLEQFTAGQRPTPGLLRRHLAGELEHDWAQAGTGQPARYAPLFFPATVTGGDTAAARDRVRSHLAGQAHHEDTAASEPPFAALAWQLPMTMLGPAGPQHIGPPHLPAAHYLWYDQDTGHAAVTSHGQPAAAELLWNHPALAGLNLPAPATWAQSRPHLPAMAARDAEFARLNARFTALASPASQARPALRGRQLQQAYGALSAARPSQQAIERLQIINQHFQAVITALET